MTKTTKCTNLLPRLPNRPRRKTIFRNTEIWDYCNDRKEVLCLKLWYKSNKNSYSTSGKSSCYTHQFSVKYLTINNHIQGLKNF